MKKWILLFTLGLFTNLGISQNILVVNDNDNILYNTDTVLIALNNSAYSSYNYWSIPDSGGVYPNSAFLELYDLVIWYASTDGVGLAFWDGTNAGNSEIVSYVITGKPFWIIGQDVLYQMYGGSSASFTSGSFANDYMGIASYDNQSYADDGNLGVAQVDLTMGAPGNFANSLQWTFSTAWYVDGCTPSAGTISIYEMGPSGYVLAGSKSMFHNNQSGINVMSTFFDPALIDTRANRIAFFEAGINYLLDDLNVNAQTKSSEILVYPSPARDAVTIQAAEIGTATFVDLSGKQIMTNQLTIGKNNVAISNLPPGIYIIQVKTSTGIATEKLIIE